MISVIILTKDEEVEIAECLESVSWCDDVHVLDSGSTDKTVEIATKLGAHISVNRFQSFGQQRNYALDNITIKYDWILFLDADERVTKTFHSAIINSISTCETTVAGFYCCWKMILYNVWLKRCDNFPKWQFRILRKGRARFTDYGHGQKEGYVDGKIEYIKEPYLHYGFSKGWHQWIDRHNKYSSIEAKVRLENVPPIKNIFSKHGSVRNPALKAWLTKIPGWPLLRFLQAYIIKFGFLEGIPGFTYCANMAFYEFLIQIKIRELKYKSLEKETIH